MDFSYLRLHSSNDQKLRNLLRNNWIGTPGESMVYRHRNVEEKLNHLKTPYFVTVGSDQSILGMCCFIHRTIHCATKPISAYYIRYFTFRTGFRSAGQSKSSRKGRLEEETNALLEGKLLDDDKPHLYYAYIDPNNVRSIRMANMFGFKTVGGFNTIFFSRFFPKRNNQVVQVGEQRIPEVVDKISRQYTDHSFLSFENIGFGNNFYAIEKDGELVAGVQASPENWEVRSVPGIGGKQLLRFISRIPVLGKLFGADFKFLSIEGIFYPEGKIEMMDQLINDVLARTNLKTAIVCMDPNSGIYEDMMKLNRGLMGRMVAQRKFSVVAKFQGVKEMRSELSYVSAFDVM